MKRALLLLFFASAAAAQEVAVLGPDPEVVRLGEEAAVTLVLDGAPEDATLLSVPGVDGLDIVPEAPRRSSFQSLERGRLVRGASVSWRVALVPRRAGEFDVPPFELHAAGRSLRSAPLRLEVLATGAGSGEHAFVEVSAPREEYFVQEPVRLLLRIGVEKGFLEAGLLPLSRLNLDVPVHLRARWLRGLPGAAAIGEEADAAAGGAGKTFAEDGAPVHATRVLEAERDGRSYLVLECERTLLPLRSGDLRLPGPVLGFAYATRFREDLFRGRVPEDARDAVVHGAPLRLCILPLPEEGRPPEWGGAVGRFTARAEADPRRLEAGSSLRLALVIEGEGNLESFEAPGLQGLAGFHVLGKIEEKSRARRQVVYDLAPLGVDVKEAPGIAFPCFDTSPPAGYRVLQTEPIPLEVLPRAGGAGVAAIAGGETARRALPGLDIRALKPIGAAPHERTQAGPSAALFIGALLVPWVLALCVLLLLRRRALQRSDPHAARARRAAAAFLRRVRRPGADVSGAFAEFLAARLKCKAAAVIAPRLGERLEAVGVPAELAARAAALLDGLVAARYGGAEPERGAEAARGLVGELEAAFLSHGSAA